MMDLTPLRDAIEHATGRRPAAKPEALGGGCIHHAFRLGDFFVKANTCASLPLFEAERLGLEALQRTGAVRVPAPLCTASSPTHAFLVLDYLDHVLNHAVLFGGGYVHQARDMIERLLP